MNESKTHPSQRRRALLQWAYLLAGPVAWAVQLQTLYALSQYVCRGQWGQTVPNVVTAVCFSAALLGAVFSGAVWHSSGSRTPVEHDDATLGRVRLMSIEGVLTGLLFSLVIAAQWIATMMLSPCAA